MMYCTKNLQCNKELQSYNNYIHFFYNYRTEKWIKTSVNFEDLLRGINRALNNLKETFKYNASLAQKLY
jgi:hypothetical protein